MGSKHQLRTILKWTAGAVGYASTAYATYAAVTWVRYGNPAPAKPEEADPLLDQFMPVYEVVERHHIRVAAPPEVTFAAACKTDLMRSPIIRMIFRTRELILRSKRGPAQHRGVLAFTKAIGWSVLAEVPNREIVMGAVTQPWNPNVVFRQLSSDQFVSFSEPEYVKIAWTLRADPIGDNQSVFRHETRVTTTDAVARAKFRRYWACFSPGIKLIRWLLLKPIRKDAEYRATQARVRDETCGFKGRSMKESRISPPQQQDG
jgi:hypothetical protein